MAQERRPYDGPLRRKKLPLKLQPVRRADGGITYKVLQGGDDPFVVAEAIMRAASRRKAETRSDRKARMAAALLKRKRRLVEAQQRGI